MVDLVVAVEVVKAQTLLLEQLTPVAVAVVVGLIHLYQAV
jgi:hypothetical protein